MKVGAIRKIQEPVYAHRIQRQLVPIDVNRALAICVAVSLCLYGCVGATPLPKRVKGQGGVSEKATATDLFFIQVGQTPRTEVEEKLKQFDVRINSQDFFMARWSSSTWGVIAEDLKESRSERHWGNKNLLVEFDGAGKAKRYAVFSDQELVSRLTPVVASQPPLDLSHPVEIEAILGPGPSSAGVPGKIVLTPGTFSFKESGTPKKPHSFQVAVADITGIGSSRIAAGDPVHTLQAIHFDKKIREASGGLIGRHHRAYFNLTVPGLAAILKFVEQSKAQ